MSQMIERLVRRQQALQQSCSTAWVLFAAVVPVAFVSLTAVFFGISSGSVVSISGFVGVLIAVSTTWAAWRLFSEARRLGRLLKDPEVIMSSDRGSDLIDSFDWSILNPFSGHRRH